MPPFVVWFWLIGVSLILGVSGFIFWLFWWPLRLFLYSLIPAHAAYAWVGKLIIIILVGWLGGIGIPMIFLFGSFMILLGGIGIPMIFLFGGFMILLAITSEV